jgi:hypothetical protein
MHRKKYLGGDDNFVATTDLTEGAADDFLARSTRIGVGRIEKVDAQLDRARDNRPAPLFIQGPRMRPALR